MNDLQKRLLEAANKSAAELDCINRAEHPDYQFLSLHIRRFLQFKLELSYLPPEEKPFNQVIGEHIAKSMHVDLSLLTEVDVPSGCTAATAVINARILLLIALEKGLHFKFPVEVTAELRTLGDLIAAIAAQLEQETATSPSHRILLTRTGDEQQNEERNYLY